MKKGIQIILVVLFSSSLFAQQENSNFKNDFGLNVNAILSKVVSKKVPDEITNPFPNQFSLLTFRRFVSPKLALRLGLGYDKFSRNDSLFNLPSGLSLIENDKFKFYAIHFGIQKNVIDREKVKLTFGWDCFFRRESREEKRKESFIGVGIPDFEISSNKVYRESNLGFGTPIGIQYFITNHIFISTEFSLELSQTFFKSKSGFEELSNSGYQDNTTSINLDFRPPLALFLHYRF